MPDDGINRQEFFALDPEPDPEPGEYWGSDYVLQSQKLYERGDPHESICRSDDPSVGLLVHEPRAQCSLLAAVRAGHAAVGHDLVGADNVLLDRVASGQKVGQGSPAHRQEGLWQPQTSRL